MSLEQILDKYPQDVENFKNEGTLDMGTKFFEELFEYYLNSGEMPYGVAKARTGDPDQWIADQLDDYFHEYKNQS